MRASIAALSPAPPTIVVLVLVDRHFSGAAELIEGNGLELEPEILGNCRSAGHDRDVLEHGLA